MARDAQPVPAVPDVYAHDVRLGPAVPDSMARDVQRRRATNARSALVSNAKRALPIKKVADIGTPQPSTRSASPDMQPIPNTDIAPLGALTQQAKRPVLERSHKVP